MSFCILMFYIISESFSAFIASKLFLSQSYSLSLSFVSETTSRYLLNFITVFCLSSLLSFTLWLSCVSFWTISLRLFSIYYEYWSFFYCIFQIQNFYLDLLQNCYVNFYVFQFSAKFLQFCFYILQQKTLCCFIV